MSEDFDTLVSPSKYSKRGSPEVVIQNHIDVTTNESRRVQEAIPSERNIPYGNPEFSETLDIFGTDLPANSPILVYISGGYWQQLSGDISAYPVQPMYDADIKTIVVDYARAPGITVTEITQQVENAICWIANYAEENSVGSIVLAGHSAGCQLIAMALSSHWFMNVLNQSTASIFKSVFYLSGVYDLKLLTKTYVNEALKMTIDEAVANSPQNRIIANRSERFKTNVLVAEHDTPWFKSIAKDFAQKLLDEGIINVSFQTIPMVDHFDLVEKLRSPKYVVTKNIILDLKSL